MSGRTVDLILEWSLDGDGVFHSTQLIRWPMLRTLPDNTHASLQRKLSDDHGFRGVLIDGKPMPGGVTVRTAINGVFSVTARHGKDLTSQRTIFPSVSSPAVIELIELNNEGGDSIQVEIPQWSHCEDTAAEKGRFGAYTVRQFVHGSGSRHLSPGESLFFAVVRSARRSEEAPYCGDPIAELGARQSFVGQLKNHLCLDTPDADLNQLFEFSKIRAAESIFATRSGLLHSPGGYNKYLAAIWANDQAEYANPFFPFLGDVAGNESAINSFRLFARYMNPEYNPLPSSIVAEGRGFWNGVGDRGDMAMIAYGAARFALASGNRKWSEELWPLIEWCLEYCERQKTPQGVIASDCDELETRFPSGNANLCTSSLYYDALISARFLARELNRPESLSLRYEAQARELREAIENHFGAKVEGFDTYRYFEGNEVLRSWICIPLTVDIFDRAGATVDALFSPKLWASNGLLTQSGKEVVWDRSTLYALRGVFACGQAQTALTKLNELSRKRLRGDHVPYLIEADSEFNESQLSAESALYCRIFTEGLFGIRPTSLDSFTCKPALPKEWSRMAVNRVQAFGRSWNLEVSRIHEEIHVRVTDPSGRPIYDASGESGKSHTIRFQ